MEFHNICSLLYLWLISLFIISTTHKVADRIRNLAEFLLIRVLFLFFLIALYRAAFWRVLASVWEAKLCLSVKKMDCIFKSHERNEYSHIGFGDYEILNPNWREENDVNDPGLYISQRKKIHINPVFSIWVNFNRISVNQKLFLNSKSFKNMFF